MHDLNVFHRDVKAENFVLRQNTLKGGVLLIDFGLATKNPGDWTGGKVGTQGYFAPEVLQYCVSGMNYAPSKADIWSLGVTLFIVSHGRMPWTDICGRRYDHFAKEQANGHGACEAIYSYYKYKAMSPLAYELTHIIDAMMKIAPQERPTAAEITTMSDALHLLDTLNDARDQVAGLDVLSRDR